MSSVHSGLLGRLSRIRAPSDFDLGLGLDLDLDLDLDHDLDPNPAPGWLSQTRRLPKSPTMSILLLAVGVMVLGLTLHQVMANIRFHRKYKFPNLVPGLPLVGNLFHQPHPAGTWGIRMREQYGDMFTQKLGSRYLVYLSSSEDVEKLVDKRLVANSRPPRPNLFGIMSGAARMVMMGYTDEWRRQRKMYHALLNSVQAGDKFTPYQDLESKQLAYELLRRPADWNKAGARFANSVILSVLFGRRSRLEDELLDFIAGYSGVLGAHMNDPLVNPPDFVNALWFLPEPLQWWRRKGFAFQKKHIDMFKKEVDLIEQKMEHGTAKPCFAVDVLRSPAMKDMTEVERIYAFSTLVEAGSDTTRVSTLQMLAAAACYPAWAAKARALLDEVCGANAERLPVLADRPRIPYITAAVKETLRWRPFLQTGVPHTSTEDIEYKGFRFPADTDFTWNAYSIALDEREYKDPVRFEPERFMNEDVDKPAKGHWGFGAGRRICAGLNVAVTNLWISTAVILYCFDITEDPNHPIDQYNTIWEAPVPFPFRIKITPRSQAHVDLIERSFQEIAREEY